METSASFEARSAPSSYPTESSWRTSRLSRFRFTCFKPGAGGCPQRQGFFSISRLSASGGGSHRFESQLRPKKLVAYVRCLPEHRPLPFRVKSPPADDVVYTAESPQKAD